MKEQSEAVAINIESTAGPHYEDVLDESSTSRSNQEIQEEPPKIPKAPEKIKGPAPSGNNNQRTPDLPSRLLYMLKDAESSTPRSNQQPEGPKIPKVPELLCNLKKDEGCFIPGVVSIGPYHNRARHVEEFEKLKIKLVKKYCKNLDGMVELYKRVEAVAVEAREFYNREEMNHWSYQRFIVMMFVDGCFILEFIMWLLGAKEYYDIGMKNNEIANVKRDLFLLENQLPYIVLDALKEGHKEYNLHEWKERLKI